MKFSKSIQPILARMGISLSHTTTAQSAQVTGADVCNRLVHTFSDRTQKVKTELDNYLDMEWSHGGPEDMFIHTRSHGQNARQITSSIFNSGFRV